MKKYFVLTSILALAACGGGSGGGNHGTVIIPNDNLTPEQRAAVESNKNITSMLTYLETDASGNTITSRSASTRNSGTKQTAGAHDLSDVKFAVIDEDWDVDDSFQFIVDENKKIIGFNVGLKEIDDYPNADSDDPEFNRNDDNSNKFTGLIKEADWINAELEYKSLGKQVGLRYSDFGNVQIKRLSDNSLAQRFIFIGGYDDAKKIDEITGNATFAGVASGSVSSIKGGEDSGKVLNLDTSTNTDETRQIATLNFNNGTSTLNAKFDNWYDVTYVKNNDDESITFNNYTDTRKDVNGEDVAENTFKMINDTGNEFTISNTDDNKYHIYDDGTPTDEYANALNSEIRYFGDNGTPSEAVGMIQIRDSNNYSGNMSDYNEHHEVRMNLVFGGKAE